MLLPLLTVVTGCVDPARYGAVPDDGRPDQHAIQQAIDEAARTTRHVCLGPGVFHLERVARKKGAREWGSLMITSGVELSGTGPDTILRLAGPGGRDDWRAIEIKGARGVYLHDFAIDGLDAYDTEEQTHLVDISPGSSDVTITRMKLGPMRRPGDRVGAGIGGDCIRLLGKLGAEVSDVMISSSTLVDCDRSGIALQRGLRRISVANTTIENTGDQAIDFEPTGKGTIEDVVLTHLTITHHPDAQGPDAVALGGHGKWVTRRITLSDSRIIGGGIRLIDVADVLLLRNTVVFDAPRKGPVISMLRRAEQVRITRNTLTRTAAALPGPVIAATHLDGRLPRGVSIDDNTIEQATPATVIRMTSASDTLVRRNRVAYTANDPRIAIVDVSAVAGDLSGVTVTDNAITGDADAVVAVKNRDRVIRRVTVHRNQASRTFRSVACKGKPAAFEGIEADADGVARAACKGVVVRTIVPAAGPKAGGGRPVAQP